MQGIRLSRTVMVKGALKPLWWDLTEDRVSITGYILSEGTELEEVGKTVEVVICNSYYLEKRRSKYRDENGSFVEKSGCVEKIQ